VLSLELARKLKDLGLNWQPEVGDTYWRNEADTLMLYCGADPAEDDVWIPRLDQLLTEIEKRYTGSIHIWNPRDDRGKWAISLGGRFKVFFADDIDNAAAQALLWLLEREAAK
jgi:hypothetical protein